MSVAPIQIIADTILGRFTYQVAIHPNGRQFNVDYLEPCGGHGNAGSYTERLKQLLGNKYEGNKELQAFTEGILLGAHACFLCLCRSTVDVASLLDDPLCEHDLKCCGSEDNLAAFQLGCKMLHRYLLEEMKGR